MRMLRNRFIRGKSDHGLVDGQVRAIVVARAADSLQKGCRCGPVAQRLEQGTHNPLVAGSNPAGPTTFAVRQEEAPPPWGGNCGAHHQEGVRRPEFRWCRH
jgi:hypothetical protein